MRKLTIRLSDDEYAVLEYRAQQERRSVREMAERLVTQPPAVITITPDWTWRPNVVPWSPTIWSSPNTCDSTNVYTLPIGTSGRQA